MVSFPKNLPPNEEACILVIDDDEFFLRNISEILQREFPAIVYTTASTIEGLEIAKQHRPHVILLDLDIPEIDGISALELLRQYPETVGSIVIICSSHEIERPIILKLSRFGIHGYIVKKSPFPTRLLLEKIRPFLPRPFDIKLAHTFIQDEPEIEFKKKNVLIIDDDTFFRKSIKELITLELGSHVIEAIDSKTAVSALSREKPHIVILDINLPGMNGVRFLEYMRITPEFRKIPVIFCSAASVNIELLQEIQKLQISGFIVKNSPFDSAKLISTLKKSFQTMEQ